MNKRCNFVCRFKGLSIGLMLFIFPSFSNTQEDLLINWKSDERGCKNIRSFEMAKSILDKYTFVGKTEKETIELIGSPDEIEKEANVKRLLYFFECLCEDKSIVCGGVLEVHVSQDNKISSTKIQLN